MNDRRAAAPPAGGRTGGVGSEPDHQPGPVSRRSQPMPRPPSDIAREFGVREALLTTGDAEVEVYVGWDTRPVGVAPRGRQAGAESWEIVGPILRERVLAAVAPLLAAGWHLAGSFPAAARWDMTRGTGRDLYEGCWVRMRRENA